MLSSNHFVTGRWLWLIKSNSCYKISLQVSIPSSMTCSLVMFPSERLHWRRQLQWRERTLEFCRCLSPSDPKTSAELCGISSEGEAPGTPWWDPSRSTHLLGPCTCPSVRLAKPHWRAKRTMRYCIPSNLIFLWISLDEQQWFNPHVREPRVMICTLIVFCSLLCHSERETYPLFSFSVVTGMKDEGLNISVPPAHQPPPRPGQPDWFIHLTHPTSRCSWDAKSVKQRIGYVGRIVGTTFTNLLP